MIRDGRLNYIVDSLSSCIQAQCPPNTDFLLKVREKLKKVIDRGCITSCDKFISLIHFFPVSKSYIEVNDKKEVNDSRMVYDTTSSRFNEVVWSPWFLIPTAISHLRSVKAGTFIGNCDIGDIFLNFMLNLVIRPYAGLILRIFLERKDKKI